MCTVLLPPGGYPIAVDKYININTSISAVTVSHFPVPVAWSSYTCKDNTSGTVQHSTAATVFQYWTFNTREFVLAVGLFLHTAYNCYIYTYFPTLRLSSIGLSNENTLCSLWGKIWVLKCNVDWFRSSKVYKEILLPSYLHSVKPVDVGSLKLKNAKYILVPRPAFLTPKSKYLWQHCFMWWSVWTRSLDSQCR
jgi:hypothetical protein